MMAGLNLKSYKQKILFALFDIAAFSAALVLSCQIHPELILLSSTGFKFIILLFMFLTVKLSVFIIMKMYDISWKFISLHDLANIGKGCLLSSGILFIILFGFNIQMFGVIPRSILLLDLVFSFVFSSGFKISRRMYYEVVRKNIGNNTLPRVLIVGAGNTGEKIIREINRSSKREYNPVGFVDDDKMKQNIFLQGLKVLGTTDDIPAIIKTYNIEEIIIAMLVADRKFHKRILKFARECGVNNVKVVSTINDLSNIIQVKVQDIKDIDVCDLIGRQAISINTKEISGYLKNKRILITGAAGSIGSEIARQVCFYNPERVGILDINESDLALLELNLKYEFQSIPVKMLLCDISNQEKVNQTFSEFIPDVVFHAAAYKHVPVLEKFPEEGVRVNIIGTYNLAKASVLNNVRHFILISTDKAVNPSSIMGVTKRIAEIIVTNAGLNGSSDFVAVRFGNVLGSRGSVLPIFLEQIKHGGPLTVTHPEMKRYFMTIPESVALVLQAAATGKNSDVFVLDMGEPIKIVDLARELISLNNLEPDKDIAIEYIGIREGEKLFEEIFTAEEGVEATNYNKIFRARMSDQERNIDDIINEFSNYDTNTTKKEWIQLFKRYVPSFSGTDNSNVFYPGEQKKRLANH